MPGRIFEPKERWSEYLRILHNEDLRNLYRIVILYDDLGM
jgi:hypothetical protein